MRDSLLVNMDVDFWQAIPLQLESIYRETGNTRPETFANVFLPPSSIRSAPTLFTTTVQTAVADIPTTGLF